jgi:hypothetical protein
MDMIGRIRRLHRRDKLRTDQCVAPARRDRGFPLARTLGRSRLTVRPSRSTGGYRPVAGLGPLKLDTPKRSPNRVSFTAQN